MRNLVTKNGGRYGLLQLCLTVVFALVLAPAMALGQTFVQIVGNTPTTATAVTFLTAENAGDLNVVVVGWSDESASVTSVTDSNSNNYILASTSGGESQSIAMYYARNISVATTTTPTVTVVFSNPNEVADVRVLEYTGFSSATVTVDNWIGNAGSGTPGTSTSVTTSTQSLLVGGGTAGYAFATGGLPGYMTARGGLDTFGNVVMDSNGAVAPGAYQASASVNQGAWVMQVVGFSIGGITTQTPTVTSIAPTGGGVAGGDQVTIMGTNFSPGATALFGTAPTGLSLVNCVVTPPTSMTCNTPAFNSGPKDLTIVNVDGKNGSLLGAYTYSINDPTITSISPATTTTNGNTTVTITGSDFEAGAQVNVGGPLAPTGIGLFGDNVVVSPTSITFTTPAIAVGAADVEVRNPDGGNATDPSALTYTLGTGAINFIQRADAATGSATSMAPGQMANPQTKGDTNIVVIGWGDVAHSVASVTDTEGNVYQATIPTVNGSDTSQTIYYAKSIKGDNPSCAPACNTITVTFNGAAKSPDARFLEYSGLDPNNPLDTGASNSGTGTTADTLTCATTSASEVIVAGATVDSFVTAAGPLYTTVDYTNNGDNVEHQITSAIGSCEATTILSAGNWVIQSVAFKAAAAGPGFTLTANPPTSETVTAGSNASYSLAVAAQGGFSGTVGLACTGLPSGAACGFTPTSPVTAGPVTLLISTTGSTPAGTSTVTVTGTSTGLPNQIATVTLIVSANTTPGFTLAATALSPATVSPGGSATSTITITDTNGFAGSVAFSCAITGGGTPAPTCSFSAVTNGSSTLTVNTTANSTANSPRATGLFYALLLPIGGMTLLGAGFSSRRKMLLGILLICMMIAGFIFMTACSSGSSSTTTPPGGGTPAGTYTVTVSGTATGATTQTLPVTLVVN